MKVPQISGADRDVYAKKVADLGLAPEPVSLFNDAKKGTLFQVEPKPGTEVQPGQEVKISVSAGSPQIAYDDDKDVLVKSSARGQKLQPVAKGSQQEKDPAWSADGSAIAYTSDGQVFLKNLADKDGSPIPLTKEGERFRDLAWAPTADVNTLALIKSGTGDQLTDAQSSLCFGAIDAQGMTTACKPVSENLLGRKINWAPDGKSLLVFAAKPDGSAFGMMEFTTDKPYSAKPEDWDNKGFVTDVSKPRRGRARRDDLAGRQAARRGRADQERDEPAGDEGGRHAARGREGAQRPGVQGDLAARRAGAGRRARGRLLRGHGRARAAAGRGPEGPDVARADRRQPGLPAALRGVGSPPVLCPDCRRQVTRGAAFCGSCGSPLGHTGPPLELVLAGGIRIPLVEELMIGRGPAATLRLEDPSVSRVHARISAAGSGSGARIEDAGSSHGTFVDGTRVTGPLLLRDGARIRLGDQELTVERRRDTAEAGKTIVVRPGASLVASAVTPAGVVGQATQFGMRPRVRSGYALKQLDASEGSRRWVLRDLESNSFLRLSDNDAQLFRLLDGSRSLVELVGEAERRFGPTGAARLARLLADLGERGLMSGVAASNRRTEAPESFWRKLVTPREKVFPGLGRWFDALYRRGGWVLFTQPALWLIGALCLAGVGVFVALIALRYGTPFVVASKIGLGGLVFLLGRFLVVAVHETAHGLVMASYGRRIDRAGLKLVAIFPYAFVDTSEAWFEPRARRIAISAAGPVSDFSRRRAVRDRLPAAARRDDPRHLLPGRVRGLRRRAVQPQPVHRARRLPHARRLAARAGPAAAGARAVRAAAVGRRAQRRLPGARALLALGAGVDGARGLLRGGDVAALPAGDEGAGAGVDRLHGAGVAVGRVLRPGARRRGEAAGRARAGR